MYRLITLVVATLLVLASPSSAKLDVCSGGDASTGYLEEVYSPNFPDLNAQVNLVKGQVYTFGMKFFAGSDSATLKPAIFAVIGIVEAPWAGAGNNACLNMTESTSCPLVKDEYYHYEGILTVPSEAPNLAIIFQWGLEGADGKNQICFRMNAKISAS